MKAHVEKKHFNVLYACDVCHFSNHDRLVVVCHIETNHIENKLTGSNDIDGPVNGLLQNAINVITKSQRA